MFVWVLVINTFFYFFLVQLVSYYSSSHILLHMTDLVIIFFRELMDCSHCRTWLAGWTLLPNVTHFKYYNLPLSVVTCCSREAGVPCDPHRPCEGWDKQHPSPPDRRIGLSTHLDWGHYGCYSSRERAHGTELKANRRPLGWLGYFVYPKYMKKILEAPPDRPGEVKYYNGSCIKIPM